jgi:hypothetical protein
MYDGTAGSRLADASYFIDCRPSGLRSSTGVCIRTWGYISRLPPNLLADGSRWNTPQPAGIGSFAATMEPYAVRSVRLGPVMLQEDALSKLLAEFERYTRSLAHIPQTKNELADCSRAYFGSWRGPIERDAPLVGLGFDLPDELIQRGRAWIDAALAREWLNTQNARWSLGFDNVPFPGNAGLADEFVEWWRKEQLPLAQFISRSAPVPSAELAEVLGRLRLRSRFSNLRWTDDEFQAIVRKSVFEELESASKRLVEHSGCSMEDAARWILAGVAPKQSAFSVQVTRKNFGGPDHVEMHINPEVATPEDVRAAYRRAIRGFLFTSRGARLARFDASYWTWGRVEKLTLDDLYELWNDVHPLWRFKNVESFRVSRLNAIRRYRDGEEIRKLKRRSPRPPSPSSRQPHPPTA